MSQSKSSEKKVAVNLERYPFAAHMKVGSPKVLTCMLYFGIEQCDNLRNASETDMFPLDEYKDLAAIDESAEKRKNPFNINRYARAIVQYICARFVWELSRLGQVNLTDANIETRVASMASMAEDMQFNISQLIIATVNAIPINAKITKSHGLEVEIMTRIGDTLPACLSYYAAKMLTQFIKVLAFNFMNEFWYNTPKTIGDRNFRTVLANLEINAPENSKTVSAGLMAEMNQFIAEALPKSAKDSDEDQKDDDAESKAEKPAKPPRAAKKPKAADDSNAAESAEKPAKPPRAAKKPKAADDSNESESSAEKPAKTSRVSKTPKADDSKAAKAAKADDSKATKPAKAAKAAKPAKKESDHSDGGHSDADPAYEDE